MEEKIVQLKIDDLVPKMKTLPSVQSLQVIPNQSVVSAKADGEFTQLVYNRYDKSYTLNKWGHQRFDFPALNEFANLMQKRPEIETAELLCELYAKEDDTPLKLPQFIHYVKSKNPALLNKVHIGVWELLKVNGVAVSETYAWKLEEVESWLKEGRLVSVLPYLKPQMVNKNTLEIFWNVQVERRGFEGLVIHTDTDIYKVKPIADLDAVIIAINKHNSYGKGNLFAQKQVTTVKLALMREDGKFIEVGDCASGIDRQLRSALWTLVENYKVGEDEKVVWVKPLVVCTIEYTDLYKAKNKVYDFNGVAYYQVSTTDLIRFKSPRLKTLRPDKTVNPTDIRITQIPLAYL